MYFWLSFLTFVSLCFSHCKKRILAIATVYDFLELTETKQVKALTRGLALYVQYMVTTIISNIDGYLFNYLTICV